MQTYYLGIRVYRQPDGHYWTVGVKVDAEDIVQASIAFQALNFGAQIASCGDIQLILDVINTSGGINNRYHDLRSPNLLIPELLEFIREGRQKLEVEGRC